MDQIEELGFDPNQLRLDTEIERMAAQKFISTDPGDEQQYIIPKTT